MILAIDVSYHRNGATVAGVAFSDRFCKKEVAVFRSRLNSVEEYIPGSFFKRELPCILHLISKYTLSPDMILIDGYVFLDEKGRPGLGKYLFDALEKSVPVIGVAKSRFKTIPDETAIYRGRSRSPLYVTSAGVSLNEAKEFVMSMYGDFRIPYMLKKADRIARGVEPKNLEKGGW
ncbi:endonuclease V [Hydrogenimonas sp.]|nr:endonuclease V [Hydrogenimonas sp.]